MKYRFKIVLKLMIIFLALVLISSFASNIFATENKQTIIVLNPGHGGTATGCANSAKGLVEKDVVLKIAYYLKDYLLQYRNVKVILTHDGKNFPNNNTEDLDARCMIARNNNADLYVSLHIDDVLDRTRNGATIYCTYRKDLEKYNNGMTRLGNLILAYLGKLGIASNGVKTPLCNDKVPRYQYITTHKDGSGNIVHDQADYYNDIRACMKGAGDGYGTDFRDGSGVPAVLIEHCYMNNVNDVQKIDSESDLKKIAEADGKAIVQYFNLKLKSASSDLPFFDVSDSSWYHNAVKYVYENNIMKGYDETEFGVNDKLTRGMLASIIYKMEGAPKVNGTVKFTDMKDTTKWYYKAVLWASNKKIVNGYSNGKYGPEDYVTREQLAVILNSYAKYKKKNISKTDNLKGFVDADKVSSWALAQIKWAVGSGVITGSKDKQTGQLIINPKGNATRAEVASMIQKYCLRVGK